MRRFAKMGILQGLLCTPNNLAEDHEYQQLCEFAREQGAPYVLMNPLGPMGRGATLDAALVPCARDPLAEAGE